MEKPYKYDKWKASNESTKCILDTFHEVVSNYLQEPTNHKLNILKNAKLYVEYYLKEMDEAIE